MHSTIQMSKINKTLYFRSQSCAKHPTPVLWVPGAPDKLLDASTDVPNLLNGSQGIGSPIGPPVS